MPRNKIRKYAELHTFHNVFCGPDSIAGSWHIRYFKNNNPITLESGCGTARMSLELARRFPDRNFVGIDNKGARLWVGARSALDEQLTNTAFIYDRVEKIPEYFSSGEIDEIWITFPDPFPKPSRSGKRLVSDRYFDVYRKIGKPGVTVHFKTDDRSLFKFALRTLREQNIEPELVVEDLHISNDVPEVVKIRTEYEERHLKEGKTIRYIRFRLF
jgi:tRNA (guanine-N7-)-methyltransferase